ncbi:MAG: glycosyltransferase [Pseudomonadota bacterium]
MPSILFVHENYPAQFGAIADFLAARGWQVVYATQNQNVEIGKPHITKAGVRVVRYARNRDVHDKTHKYLRNSEMAVLNGQGFARLGAALKQSGFSPDLVVAHSGWGSGSFAKVIWPETKFIQYLEWWYNYPIIDAGPEDGPITDPLDKHARTHARNLPFFLDFQQADGVWAPTKFQADRFPDFVRAKTHVQHDGISCELFRPLQDDDRKLDIEGVPDDAPIITFTTRGMEPMRGFPTFMSAASKVLQSRSDAHVVIAGNDTIHYGRKPDGYDTWKAKALAEITFPKDRLHFTGLMRKSEYARLLRRTNAHVYLTRPFVLSWSLIEAMASAAPIICSDVAPVREAIGDDLAARFVPNHDPDAVSDAVLACLGDANGAQKMGQRARQLALDTFDVRVCFRALETLFHNTIKV